MNIEPSLVTNSQSPEVVQPGKSALHDPTVLAKLLATLNPTSGDTRSDPSLSEHPAIGFRVVTGYVVAMEQKTGIRNPSNPKL